ADRFSLFISRRSHNFAICQSRVTVSVEIPSAAAISSFVSPPKNRSSTTRALRSSCKSQHIERVIESDTVPAAVRDHEVFLECDVERASTSLLIVAGARRVDEDPAHLSRGQREEMRPIVPVHSIDVDHPQVDLVDERRWRERMVRTLSAQIAAGLS